MALLIGQEAESVEAEIAPANEIASAFSFKALLTGTLTALHVKFPANGTGTSGRIAIQEDEAGKPKAGVLAEGALTSVTLGEHEAGGLSVALVAGTTYWLTIMPLGGNLKYKAGTTTGRRLTTVKHATIAAVEAADWAASANKGPIAIWGTGTEGSGGVTIPLAAAASSSTASMALTALTAVALSAAPSTSAATLTMTAPTTVPVSAGASTSTASMAVTAPTTVPLQPAASSSNASNTLTAPTTIAISAAASQSGATLTLSIGGATIALAPAASQSGAALSLRARTTIALAPASSTSEARCTVTVPSATGQRGVIALQSAPTSSCTLGDAALATAELGDRSATVTTLADALVNPG